MKHLKANFQDVMAANDAQRFLHQDISKQGGTCMCSFRPNRPHRTGASVCSCASAAIEHVLPEMVVRTALDYAPSATHARTCKHFCSEVL